jgi:hypothetical protein
MDLSTFNKKLKQLVNKARKEESRENFEDAKDAWIDVAEFTIHFYKHTKLEPSFRNMLINKTEGIIQHVKDLDKKIRMSETLSDLSREQDIKQGETTKKPSPQSTITERGAEDIIEQEPESKPRGGTRQKKPASPTKNERTRQESISSNEVTEEPKTTELPTVPSKSPQEEPEVVNDSEFKNMPEGFKEIKAPTEFEVITPHDKEEIEKRLSISGDMSIFKHDNEEDSPKNEKTIDQANEKILNKDENKTDKKSEAIICFACGEKNAPGTKVCSNCGTKLK